ncbi:MFS domain-containing protein [Fusarium falciforme]|uniref:MFS domain-containing protein n=1 Tax=Fusarium falciforme TaxID=195108 RepID=UPI0023018775|nr:MFS domain-containing protein [Fusarium falciforme]WAO91432.1 MFS domain-containing protein [Fusarium falciforme]
MEEDSDAQTTSKQAVKVHVKTWIVVICVNFAYFSQLTAVIGSGFLAQPIAQLLGGASQTMWFNQSINLLGIAICLPVSQMADYWGRRWVLIVLLTIGFAGTMVVARAQNVATVIAGFVLIGISYGATPVLFAVPSEILPRSQRSIAQSTINMSSSIGGILSLVMGGLLLRHNRLENYRVFFYVVAAFFGLSFLGILFFYYPPPREEQVSLKLTQKLRRLDWVGYTLFAPGLTLFSIALSWSKNPYPWSDAHIIAPFVLGMVLIIGFILYEWLVKKDGIFNHAVFTHRNIVISLLAVWIDGVSFYTANTYFAQQFGMFTGNDMLISGIAFGMFFIVGGLATIIFGWASTKYRIVRMPGILCLALIVLFNVLMATTTPSTPEANYWGYAVFAGLGLGGTIPTFMVAAQLTTPPELISLVSGLVSVARPIGGVVGLAINNAIFHDSLSTELRKKISAAVIPLGFSASYMDALISAVTGGDDGALSEISGVTPDIIAAAQGGQMKAYGIAFRNCWIAAAFAFWAIDPRSEFKEHIDAPVEVEVAEEQKRLEALQVENVKDKLKGGKA